MTHSIISISKLNTYIEFKKDFSNIKKLQLLNVIQIAEQIYKGKMSYEQHDNLCKKGFDIFLKQFYCIQEQKEKKFKNK